MSKIDDKIMNIFQMQAPTDYSWHIWNSPIGMVIGLISLMICLNGFVVLAILVKYFFLMK